MNKYTTVVQHSAEQGIKIMCLNTVNNMANERLQQIFSTMCSQMS